MSEPEFIIRGKAENLDGDLVEVELTVKPGEPGYDALARQLTPPLNPFLIDRRAK